MQTSCPPSRFHHACEQQHPSTFDPKMRYVGKSLRSGFERIRTPGKISNLRFVGRAVVDQRVAQRTHRGGKFSRVKQRDKRLALTRESA